ncbi:DUF2442 domain-containing protein [Trinickia mobilis]|uniref:DUF2442 domain-containing protein n=1 Tax=Trinickia mobilis TaxID=2816356 RepID=UPI001A8DC5AA|nr:DUF2442 domain-containing protein [Trinickia mobilis]
MEGAAVGAHFDSAHLFLDLSGGQTVEFPLDWFPVLQAATAAEREHFAISMDRQQLFWPEIDEDVNVLALLSYRPEIDEDVNVRALLSYQPETVRQ